ncbi:ABC transporter ATP-binding protein [Bacillota bacterium Meth-B3]|nr:ABC transporter ATP-binding protein [Christensenellaceae bacterium]MEA5069241.1 ABC transporter ATP-binding protein [Christensenellaceae bacterium]
MSETLLKAVDVCKYFAGLKAVEMVNMEVREGDIYGIIGPNGAGKTTFFNCCTGIYPPTKGEVYLEGERISRMTPEQIACRGVTRTFQNIQLFKFMSVLDNVKIGCHTGTRTGLLDALLHTRRYREDERYAVEKSIEVLREIGMYEVGDVMAGTLPYGMQRKVEIARALALGPRILLLDEPAAGMNPLETKSLMEFIKMLGRKGYTILVIEHDMKFVMNACNRILVLNFGQKIAEGTPEEIRADQAVREAYFGKGLIVEGVGERA